MIKSEIIRGKMNTTQKIIVVLLILSLVFSVFSAWMSMTISNHKSPSVQLVDQGSGGVNLYVEQSSSGVANEEG